MDYISKNIRDELNKTNSENQVVINQKDDRIELTVDTSSNDVNNVHVLVTRIMSQNGYFQRNVSVIYSEKGFFIRYDFVNDKAKAVKYELYGCLFAVVFLYLLYFIYIK